MAKWEYFSTPFQDVGYKVGIGGKLILVVSRYLRLTI